MVAMAIYVVWYVVDALDGFDPIYKPHKDIGGDVWSTEIKGGAEIFDPTKKDS